MSTDKPDSPPGAANATPSSGAPGQRPAAISTAGANRLAQLDTELRDIVASRDELGWDAFAILMDCWYGAATRELTALEFPPSEIGELRGAWLRAVAAELSRA